MKDWTGNKGVERGPVIRAEVAIKLKKPKTGDHNVCVAAAVLMGKCSFLSLDFERWLHD